MVAQIQSLQEQASSGREAALLRDTMVGCCTLRPVLKVPGLST